MDERAWELKAMYEAGREDGYWQAKRQQDAEGAKEEEISSIRSFIANVASNVAASGITALAIWIWSQIPGNS